MKKSLMAGILITLLLLASCTQPPVETPSFDPSETAPPAETEPTQPTTQPQGKDSQPTSPLPPEGELLKVVGQIGGPMMAGASQVIREGTPDYPDTGIIWRLVEKYRVTTMFTAPTTVRR